MPLLFPQLLADEGVRLAAELSIMTVEQALRRAETRPQDPSSNCEFSATGGTPATPEQLADLRNKVLAKAREYGYPVRNTNNLKCDAEVALILRDRMNVTPHEAAHEGIWEYLACVLMPDVVVWRFRDANGRTAEERFRSRRRNNFSRLWWRAYVIAGNLAAAEAVSLLSFLTEDNMVATMERPGLFGYLRVIRLYYSEFRKAAEEGELRASQEDVNRDVHKRLLRLVAVRALELLPDDVLRAELRALIGQSAAQFRRLADLPQT